MTVFCRRLQERLLCRRAGLLQSEGLDLGGYTELLAADRNLVFILPSASRQIFVD